MVSIRVLAVSFIFSSLFLGNSSILLAKERMQDKLAPKEKSSLVLVSSGQAPEFKDDSDLDSLKKSVEQSLIYYSSLPPETSFSFGKDQYKVKDLIQTAKDLKDFLERPVSIAELNRFIHEQFRIYRSVSKDDRGLKPNVTFSAYHEHTLTARFSPTSEYRYAIYGRPSDLVDVYLENFDLSKKGERIAGKVEGKTLVPYYTRKEIDTDKILAGKNLEIAWAKDPLAILFLQIQGSGWLQVPDSTQTFHVRYAGDNGRPFRSVGAYLIESGKIPKEGFSRTRMIEYMSQLSDENKQSILNQNPRYIFFEIVSSTNLTRGSLLVPLTAGRSIASDPKFYPLGALAWIRTECPLFDDQGTVVGKKPLTRFVLNQDEGGAIKGPERIDFFVGGGKEAERIAQKLWFLGELYFFIKKPVD